MSNLQLQNKLFLENEKCFLYFYRTIFFSTGQSKNVYSASKINYHFELKQLSYTLHILNFCIIKINFSSCIYTTSHTIYHESFLSLLNMSFFSYFLYTFLFLFLVAIEDLKDWNFFSNSCITKEIHATEKMEKKKSRKKRKSSIQHYLQDFFFILHNNIFLFNTFVHIA